MNKKIVSLFFGIIGVISAIVSLVLAFSDVDVKKVGSAIFLTLCFIALSIIFNRKDKNK